jgi:hypothetical protein
MLKDADDSARARSAPKTAAMPMSTAKRQTHFFFPNPGRTVHSKVSGKASKFC